jgi:hypothetical protein
MHVSRGNMHVGWPDDSKGVRLTRDFYDLRTRGLW